MLEGGIHHRVEQCSTEEALVEAAERLPASQEASQGAVADECCGLLYANMWVVC